LYWDALIGADAPSQPATSAVSAARICRLFLYAASSGTLFFFPLD
jgi:hypothetical protein